MAKREKVALRLVRAMRNRNIPRKDCEPTGNTARGLFGKRGTRHIPNPVTFGTICSQSTGRTQSGDLHAQTTASVHPNRPFTSWRPRTDTATSWSEDLHQAPYRFVAGTGFTKNLTFHVGHFLSDSGRTVNTFTCKRSRRFYWVVVGVVVESYST